MTKNLRGCRRSIGISNRWLSGGVGANHATNSTEFFLVVAVHCSFLSICVFRNNNHHPPPPPMAPPLSTSNGSSNGSATIVNKPEHDERCVFFFSLISLFLKARNNKQALLRIVCFSLSDVGLPLFLTLTAKSKARTARFRRTRRAPFGSTPAIRSKWPPWCVTN